MHNSLKELVLQATDIVSVVGERVALKKVGKDFQGLCPFHPDKRPSLTVSPAKQLFKCFSCGAGGDVIGFVKRFEHLEYRDALLFLARRAGINATDSPAQRAAAERRDALLRACQWASELFVAALRGSAASAARAYAQRRGLTDDTLSRFRIGLAVPGNDTLIAAARERGLSIDLLKEAGLVGSTEQGRLYDRFRNRLMFPICDPQGRPIAFGGRTLGDDPAKYLNSPESPLFSKSRVLYPFDLARRAIETQRAAIVVEGYMDAVLLHQHGFRHAVATLGTALTDAHVQLLRPLASTLYMCFDADDAGVRAADRAVEIALRADLDVRVVTLESGKDPADCVVEFGADRFEAALAGAKDAIDFKWRHTLRHYGEGARGRRAAVEAFVRFVAGATATGRIDPMTHNLVVGRLADTLGVSAEQVFDMLSGARRALPPSAPQDSDESALPDGEDGAGDAPAALASAVETVLGLLVINPECWRIVDDCVSEACGYYRTWKQLFCVLLDVHADNSEYSIGDVVARCDDREVCGLLDRVRTRCEGISDAAAHFEAARRSLATALDVLRISGLRSDLSPAGPETARAHYGSLVSLARAQHGFLPAARRGPALGASPG